MKPFYFMLGSIVVLCFLASAGILCLDGRGKAEQRGRSRRRDAAHKQMNGTAYNPYIALFKRLDGTTDEALMKLTAETYTPRLMAFLKPKKRKRFARVPTKSP